MCAEIEMRPTYQNSTLLESSSHAISIRTAYHGQALTESFAFCIAVNTSPMTEHSSLALTDMPA